MARRSKPVRGATAVDDHQAHGLNAIVRERDAEQPLDLVVVGHDDADTDAVALLRHRALAEGGEVDGRRTIASAAAGEDEGGEHGRDPRRSRESHGSLLVEHRALDLKVFGPRRDAEAATLRESQPS